MLKRLKNKRSVKVVVEQEGQKVKLVNFYKTFRIIQIIHDGVCGMKKPCVIVERLECNTKYVLKRNECNGNE